MTHFSNTIGLNGPILVCAIGVSTARDQALRAAGQPVPPPKLASLLIDTGASHTMIDTNIVAALGLTPTGSVPMHTPSTGSVPQQTNTYDIGLGFSGHANAFHVLAAHSVLASSFAGQSIDGLLGRDILETARLTYSGPDNFYYLSF